MDNAVAFALAMGLLSAASLPLGALLGVYWKPQDRQMSFFLAFGGGALFAALSVELVAESVREGHLFSMAAGAIAGGLVFKALNRLVNERGGYLRKPSTAINYWEGKAARRFAEVIGDLKRATVFGQLSPERIEALLPHVLVREFPKGVTLYRSGDPAENLYIIEEGEVDLLDPQQGRRRLEHLTGHAAFGRLSFLVGSPRATEAVTATDARLLIIPRRAYFDVLDDTPETRDIVARRMEDEDVRRFLEERLNLTADQAREWVTKAAAQMREIGSFDPPVRPASHEGDLVTFLANVGRTGFFASLPESDLKDTSRRLIAKSAPEGHTFYHLGELAQRLYILRRGAVSLIDPLDPSRRPYKVQPGEVFGQHAFFTDGPHTVTAVAAADCEFLVLRRKDFDALLDGSPTLQEALTSYLQRDQIRDYLTKRQRIDATKAAAWLDKAVKSIQRRDLFPSLAEMKSDVETHSGAAIAILLGSFLDGIPEAVVVGADTVAGPGISVALLGSIFLSNFPEALSSSAGMREQGFRPSRILIMWAGLTLLIGLVSALGAATMTQAPQAMFAVIEGFAAGAMLTVVAETMLPEAYHRGGGIVGLSTLSGFLAAVLLSALG